MEAQEIEVTIDKNGQVRLHIRGVSGETCLEITDSLEEALGGIILSRELTSEAQDTAASGVLQAEKLKQSRPR